MKDASNRIKGNIMAEIEIGFLDTLCASKTHILWEKYFLMCHTCVSFSFGVKHCLVARMNIMYINLIFPFINNTY